MKHTLFTFAVGTIGALAVAHSNANADDPPARYPRSVIARPLTLPGGVFQAGADVLGNNDLSVIAARVVGGYGVNDKLEATAYYTFALEEFEAKGDVDVNLGYAAVRGAVGGKLEVVPRLQFGYSAVGEAIRPLALGAQAQYNVTSRIAVITPGQQVSIALEEDAAMATPITVSLPIALGVQANPELYVQLDTSLATLNIADSANAFIFADTTPMSLTAIYNIMPALDVLAGAGVNLTPADPAGVGDTLVLLAGARYYGGQL